MCMTFLRRVSFYACLIILTGPIPGFADLADEVFEELKRARQQPKQLAMELQAKVAAEKRKATAVEQEAIDFLLARAKLPPLPEFKREGGMNKAAADHVRDLTNVNTKAKDHIGSDGSTPPVRLNRHGTWQLGKPGQLDGWGENISVGQATAKDIVMSLIIDKDDPNRVHRTNIFTALVKVKVGKEEKEVERCFGFVGVACGDHPTKGKICVTPFAIGYK